MFNFLLYGHCIVETKLYIKNFNNKKSKLVTLFYDDGKSKNSTMQKRT